MGRKKRKVTVVGSESLEIAGTGVENTIGIGEVESQSDVIPPPPPPPADPRSGENRTYQQKHRNVLPTVKNALTNEHTGITNLDGTKNLSSGYATTSHSAEIIDGDIYVSDGSESDEDMMVDNIHILSQQNSSLDGNVDGFDNTTNGNIAGRSIEMVLSGSKMGLMRRGIHRPQVLVQPNRQWARLSQTHQDSKNDKTSKDGGDASDDGVDEINAAVTAEERRKREQEEELSKLDPAQRAARLLAEKQRKLEEAKILARKLESEENAGRDPCLFSKRTSFDIRFDQIDDKPWLRGAGDITDFFNYGFSEEDWLEYGEQQLMIRQELIDANRQKRAPDPGIVPVIPKKPKKQNPRVAVATSNTEASEEGTMSKELNSDGVTSNGNIKVNEDDENSTTVIGPVRKKFNSKDESIENKITSSRTDHMQGPTKNEASLTNNDSSDIEIGVGIGGAWGMGAAPGSVLAKLIEEQDKQQQNSTQKQSEKKISYQHQDSKSDRQSASSSPRKARAMEYYGGGNNKHENNSALSYYGTGGGAENSGGYNENQPDRHNDHQYSWNQQSSQEYEDNRHNSVEGNWNYRGQSHVGHTDRNNSGNQNSSDWKNRITDRGSAHHHQQQQNQSWNDSGRGGYRSGSRGGSGRRSSGDYVDGKGSGRGSSYGDRSGYQRRKRPREDYDDRYTRR